jgi:glycosyltransferase involved in cell wall biosynthesis
VSSAPGDVTVVVACFNYGRFLPEAIESVRAQEGVDASVVVVDDGSTDHETLEVLDRLPDEVEVVRQANAGVSAARNAGLRRADTPYVLVLDADDRLAPGALSAMRGALEEDPSLGFAYGHMRFFGAREGVMRMPAFDAYQLLYRHTVGLSALSRSELFEQTGGFDARVQNYEDWELWINAMSHGWRGRQVNAVTLEYRRHPGAKHDADRRQYRQAFRGIRAKHAALYGRAGRAKLGAESHLGLASRAVQRWFWGARPVPARIEAALYDRLWRGGGE